MLPPRKSPGLMDLPIHGQQVLLSDRDQFPLEPLNLPNRAAEGGLVAFQVGACLRPTRATGRHRQCEVTPVPARA